MAKKLAVMVLHGMGDQGKKEPGDSSIPIYSKKMHTAVRREFGAAKFDAEIAWREVFYSHITQGNQDSYYDKVKSQLDWNFLRKFVVKYLGDVAAYRYSPKDNNTNIYIKVHDQVTKVFEQLKQDTKANAPVVVVAHSLGGHVISNYIYDRQEGNEGAMGKPPIKNVAALVTFGCNIPIFTFGWPGKHIKAIKYPGKGLAVKLRQPNWWQNYYDKDDVLGYPLIPTGAGYEALAKTHELTDIPINVGWFVLSMLPFAHLYYWGDKDLTEPIAGLLKKIANNT